VSGLPSALTASESWERIKFFAARGAFPHCALLAAPAELQLQAAADLAAMLLCEAGSGKDECAACRAWSNGNHPDLITGGEPGKPPTIGDCREIIRDIAYKPAVSSKRCALIFSADLMQLPAANSLLKLAEEPPDHGIIIFTAADENRVLPTIRSRAWLLSLPDGGRSGEETAPPSTAEEWEKWTEKNSGLEFDEFLKQFDPWISRLAGSGDYDGAWRAERLKALLSTGRLSRTMAIDLTLLALKEGIDFEHLFGDFW
jgi:DNA polymerase-3 subunit delta'